MYAYVCAYVRETLTSHHHTSLWKTGVHVHERTQTHHITPHADDITTARSEFISQTQHVPECTVHVTYTKIYVYVYVYANVETRMRAATFDRVVYHPTILLHFARALSTRTYVVHNLMVLLYESVPGRILLHRHTTYIILCSVLMPCVLLYRHTRVKHNIDSLSQTDQHVFGPHF